MDKAKQELLYILLIEWFNEIDFNKSDLLNKNKIAALLKVNLLNAGHWRNKSITRKVNKKVLGNLRKKEIKLCSDCNKKMKKVKGKWVCPYGCIEF